MEDNKYLYSYDSSKEKEDDDSMMYLIDESDVQVNKNPVQLPKEKEI